MTFSSSLPAPVQEHLQQIIQQYALYQSKVIRFNKRFLYEPMDIPLLKLTNLLKKFFDVGANEQTLKTKQRYDYIAIVSFLESYAIMIS
jgi:hypothetical protein